LTCGAPFFSLEAKAACGQAIPYADLG